METIGKCLRLGPVGLMFQPFVCCSSNAGFWSPVRELFWEMEALPGLSGFRGGVHERHDATWRIAELNTDFWSCVEGATPDGPNPKAGSAAHTRQASGGKCNGCSTTYAPDAKHTAWFSLEATKGHAAFPESVGIGIRIPFRKQAKLRALAVHLFVLRGESIDFTLLRLDLLLEREVVGCTSVDGVEKATFQPQCTCVLEQEPWPTITSRC